jgi:uncharacterized protein YfaP (DUF2135 family)
MVLALATPALAARQPMSVADMLTLLKDAPGNGYQWGGSTWSADPARQGKCVLDPPDNDNGCPKECTYPGGDQAGGSVTGSDCAGLVSKAWQLGGPQSIETPVSRRFGSGSFTASNSDWDVVDIDSLQQGDSVSNGNHVMFFDTNESGKPVWYEATGCKWNIQHHSRSKFDKAKWTAARRKDLVAPRTCTETTCSGHGTCNAGACSCTAEFSGTDCEQCAKGYFGYPSCHLPNAQCAPQGELKCGQEVTINPSQGTSQLSAYGCSVANAGGAELVYQIRSQTTGDVTLTLEGGGSLALLRDSCAAEACIASDPAQLKFQYRPGNPFFVAVESAGATGDVKLRVECGASNSPWIGDPCTDDAACKMTKRDGTQLTGFCSKLAGETQGFCSLDCTNTNGCPDLPSNKAPTFCIADPTNLARGMCVATQSDLNAYCGSVPGTTKQTLVKFNRPETTSNVCAPRPAGVAACEGNVGGRVLSAATGAPIAAAAISAVISGTPLTAMSGSNGEFLIEHAPCGSYDITIGALGYQDARIPSYSIKQDATGRVSDVLMVASGGCAQSTSIRGFVTDGATQAASPLAGATVELRNGVDSVAGATVGTATTAADGSFAIAGLAPGNYTARVMAASYSTAATNQVACNSDNNAGNVTVVPQEASAMMRIVLRWSKPPDLDLHVQLPNGNDVYYRPECRGSATQPPYTTLDVDRTTAVGPEVVSVFRYMPGTYTVFVHNFSQQVRTEFFGDDDPAIHDVSFANASATVVVYGPNGSEIAHYSPPSGTGYFWDVFSFDGGASGKISPVQRLSNGHKNPDVEYSSTECGPL